MDTAQIFPDVLDYAIRAAVIIVVFIIGRWLARYGRHNLKKVLARTDLTESFVTLFSALAYYGILLLIIILILMALGVPTTAILTVLAAILIVLGVAFQQTLGNIAAAVIFLLFEPFKVGDIIETGGVLGKVKEIQLFNTIIVTFQNKTAVIPNRNIQNGAIINFSHLGILRADMIFSVSYADDLQLVKQVLEDIMQADERVLAEPPATVVIKELTNNGINFSIRPFVKLEDYWRVQFDIKERVKLRFDETNITIPFPQRDIHLFQEK